MKHFLTKILIYFFCLLIATALWWKWMAMQPNNYASLSHEVNVKRQIERIKQITEPKIIIIGGSGCGFGLCSPLISKHFNMPVINTSTHAGLGLRLQIEIFKHYINEHDIVIVIPEYEQYTNWFYGDISALRILTTNFPEGYSYLSFGQQLYLMKYVPQGYLDAIASKNIQISQFENNPYSKESLNEYGDVEMYEYRVHKDKQWEVYSMETDINIEAVKKLKETHEYCIKQDATMLLFPPALKNDMFEKNKNLIDSIWNILIDADLPIVSCPINYRMPDYLHYDTDYHLTYDGVIYRTNKIIDDIDIALSSQCTSFE